MPKAQLHGDANTTDKRHSPVTQKPVDNSGKRHRKRHYRAEKASLPGDTPPYVHPTVETRCASCSSSRCVRNDRATAAKS